MSSNARFRLGRWASGIEAGPEVLIKACALLAIALSLSGCTAGGVGPGLLGLLTLFSLWTSACYGSRGSSEDTNEKPLEECTGDVVTYEVCDAGRIVVRRDCCPLDAECDLGDEAFTECLNGSCVQPGEVCEDDECNGEWSSFQVCEAGELVQRSACCPHGAACNFGQIPITLCDDGSCVEPGQECVQTCDGYWATYDICEYGQVVERTECCPAGWACNFGMVPVTVCDDGSCVQPGLTCEPSCDGTWETFEVCEAGSLVKRTECCPADTECNFGQNPPTICDDGSCAAPGERCSCDGYWSTYQVCEAGMLVERTDCCPAGTACNFGQVEPVACADGSCVPFGQSCE